MHSWPLRLSRTSLGTTGNPRSPSSLGILQAFREFRAPESYQERSCPFQKNSENRLPKLCQVNAPIERIRTFQKVYLRKQDNWEQLTADLSAISER